MLQNTLTTAVSALRHKKSLGSIVFAILIVATIVYFVRQTTANFRSEYASYASLAHNNDAAAFLTGAESNPTRQELNTTLAQTLTGDIGNANRYALAKNGLALLHDAEVQINDVGDIADRVAVAIVKMDLAANSASDFGDKGTMRSIVALAKKRAEITQDIRGLSYRANFETAKIFKRIMEDGGSLTGSHVSDLNALLPALTEQFDKRSGLYTDLENIGHQIADEYSSL